MLHSIRQTSCDWTVEVPSLCGYAADLWSCLTSEVQSFLSGLRVAHETNPKLRGHICYLDWIKMNPQIGVSDYESVAHEIGHAVSLRERKVDRVSEPPERAAAAFFEAADAYQDWMESRRVGEQLPLVLFAERLANDARTCLIRYFRPEDKHVLYLVENCS